MTCTALTPRLVYENNETSRVTVSGLFSVEDIDTATILSSNSLLNAETDDRVPLSELNLNLHSCHLLIAALLKQIQNS